MARVRVQHVLVGGLLTAVYVAAGRLGLSLAVVNESASPVWPPTGLALAVLLLFGLRAWPVITTGAFLVNLTTSGEVGLSVLIAIGNTLEAVAGAWITSRFAGGAAAFDRTADIVRFAVLAAIGASTIAASIGVSALLWAGLAPGSDAASIWFTWWLGDAVGALVVTPLIVLWARSSRFAFRPGRVVEGLTLAACLAVVVLVVFGASSAGTGNYPLAFLIPAPLLWSAFRFGGRETAAAATFVAVVAVLGTVRGLGPFARSSPNESLLLVQAFIGVTTTMMLSVAAEVKRRRGIETEMRSLNDALEQRVVERTDELIKANDRLVEAQRVAHVGSWEWDVTANRLWWSEELYRIYGLDPDDVIGYEGFLTHVHPDDRPLVDATVRRAMQDGRSFTFDHRILRPDGSIRILHAAGHVARDATGQPVRMMGIGHDVTERKHAEEETGAADLRAGRPSRSRGGQSRERRVPGNSFPRASHAAQCRPGVVPDSSRVADGGSQEAASRRGHPPESADPGATRVRHP